MTDTITEARGPIYTTPGDSPQRDWMMVAAHRWRRSDTKQRWWGGFAALLVASLIGAPFRPLSEDAAAGVSLVVLAVFGGLLLLALSRHPVKPRPVTFPPPSPEQVLAAVDSTEARVAAAASRAWIETLREPSWHSPYLTASRATFDGQSQLDQIVDIALRIHSARVSLGARPGGPAAHLWDRQQATLEGAAHQLGRRADALIRYRDQAARLSSELRSLEDLERLTATSTQIDGLALEVAHGHDPVDGGLARMNDEVAAIRDSVNDLLTEMMRTSELLAHPAAVSIDPNLGRPSS
ncbi:hypothetical protein [Blastococcus sp. TF02A-26]|uniref:hypothetical protein n=1 Tax=Blastococcus sp. TF02A-26 TaxID=2250577 RepID=UPI0011BFE09F|nr:hypothetical protein [Blastococcus sp. TF02A-26]